MAAAAEAEAKDRADWSVAQKPPCAPAPALVYDTLYRQGEFVPAGNPVVSLLPPENIKVRFFVPESAFATLKAGTALRVAIDGRSALDARISYLSPQPEYTPPVLYNRDNRSKLVFMIEAVFMDSSTAADGLNVLITTHYMDEAERCHCLAYGHLLARGTLDEVLSAANLSTWSITGPDLRAIAAAVRDQRHDFKRIPASLENVFIGLMDGAHDNFK